MRTLIVLTVALLVVGLAAVPVSAQFVDPLTLASSAAILPFFSDTSAGFISVFEISSPVVQVAVQTNPPKVPINPLHFIFYSSTCSPTSSPTFESSALRPGLPALGRRHDDVHGSS